MNDAGPAGERLKREGVGPWTWASRPCGGRVVAKVEVIGVGVDMAETRWFYSSVHYIHLFLYSVEN